MKEESPLEKYSIIVPVPVPAFDPWEDIPETYDKPKLCKIEDPECTACE